MKESAIPQIAPASRGALSENVVDFCRILNRHGLNVAPGSALIALRALDAIDIHDRARFRAALRTALVNRVEDIPLYSFLFDAFWRRSLDTPKRESPTKSSRDADVVRSDTEQHADDSAANDDTQPTEFDMIDIDATDEQSIDRRAARAAAPGTWPQSLEPSSIVELENAAKALARQLALTRSRRKRPDSRGAVIDLRKSMRDSLTYGGLPLTLARRDRQVARAQLLIFCDVSRSMAASVRLLFDFTQAILRHAWRVELFVFANELQRVTERWRDGEFEATRDELAACGGGTEIGRCLQNFIDDYHYCLTGNKATLIVLSDGLDAGEPRDIERHLAYLQRRTRRIIWLNPLKATAGYEPTARGMAAALPFVDYFGAAHDADAFWALLQALKENPSRRDRAA